jgi:hypothetical protein
MRRGHRVVVATLPDGEPVVRLAGLDFASIGGPEYPAGLLEWGLAELGRRRGASTFRHTIRLGVDLTRVILRDAPDALRPYRPDILVVDHALPGGNSPAERLRVPFVNVAGALAFHPDPDIPPNAMSRGPARTLLGRLSLAVSARTRDRAKGWRLPVSPGEPSFQLGEGESDCRCRNAAALPLAKNPPGARYATTIAGVPGISG